MLVARAPDAGYFDEAVGRPLDVLSSHVATALGNVRSQDRLERARRGVEARNELIELYSQLFRHHLRNDLNIVSGYATMLEGEVSGEAEEHLATVRATVDRSIDLIRRVSTLQTEIHGVEEPAPQSLRESMVAAVARAEDEHGNLTIEFDPGDFEYEVYAGTVLHRVFGDLLGNAAVHNDGPVTVDAGVETPTSKWVVVVLGDDGRRIDVSVRGNLFELGIKGPASQGGGLGLGFARRLIESYGGTVAAGTSTRGGAEFRVTLERV